MNARPVDNFTINFNRAFKRFTFFSPYSNPEKTELDKLRVIYNAFYPETKTHFFTLENGKPKFTKEDLLSATTSNALSTPNEISEYCTPLIDEITLALSSRLEGSEKISCEKFNSPAVIFYTEMLQWLKILESTGITEKTLEQVNHRLNYLYRIVENNIFGEEPRGWKHIDIVLSVIIECLEKSVIASIEKKLTQQVARDHFAQAKRALDHYIRKTVNGLFYLHTDFGKGEPTKFKQFDISSNRKQDDAQSEALVHTELYQLFMLTKAENPAKLNAVRLELKDAVALPMITYPDKAADDYSLGIHADIVDFCFERNTIPLLINLLRRLSYLRSFGRVIQDAENVAGSIGDLGLYLTLGHELNMMLTCFNSILLQIEKEMDELRIVYRELSQSLLTQGKYRNWRNNYNHFNSNMRDAKQFRCDCVKALEEAKACITRASSREYQRNTFDQITKLRKDIGLLLSGCDVEIFSSDYLVVTNGANNSSISISESKSLLDQNRELLDSMRVRLLAPPVAGGEDDDVDDGLNNDAKQKVSMNVGKRK